MRYRTARIGTATVSISEIVGAYGITDPAIIVALGEIIRCGWANPMAGNHVATALEALRRWSGDDTTDQAVDPYQVHLGGIKADTYRIAIAFDLDPVVYQALKKLLRSGRKHKGLAADVAEAITSLVRWQEIAAEDEAASTANLQS